MEKRMRRKVAAGTAALVAVAGGGAAIAATHSSPQEERQQLLKDVASQLGVTPGELSAAFESALEKRVDEAVAAGRITKAQGESLKERIQSADFPLLGFGPGLGLFGHHDLFFPGLETASAYLGLSEDELRGELESGKTLAEIAKAHGKSVDGLVDVLVADARKNLDEAVAAGRLTEAQENAMLARLEQGIRARVNGERPQILPGPGFGFRHRFGGPAFGGAPPFDGAAA